MLHNFVKDDKFNILTARREKGFLIFTGETRNPLKVGDFINYPYGENFYCRVEKINERRDSKSYPKGNGLWYSCECSGILKDEAIKASMEEK